ncbi:unnamed protein product [Hyaloperonospora brassicae]|uniref:Expansin-like EG45 domain-containing protein n=1 Tax=Hyaloperonospora brassicae TaxID=162125 RepID=A0AAV0URQ7_HYABA|nr:unnamed protein product [Hyaloperonospora brassicae]
MVRRVWLSMALVPAIASAGQMGEKGSVFTGEGTSYVLGQVSSGNCNFMYDPGVGTNYAALNNDQWESTNNCGRCAKVSCDDDRCPDKSKSAVVYLLDRCPECVHGDLDLSPEVFKEITGSHPSRYKIKWEFVDCPVEGNIQYCTKSGSSSHWLAIQPANFANGIESMRIANQAVTMVDSCYYFLLNNGVNVDISAVEIELTSVAGEKITEKLSLTSNVCTAGTSNFGASTSQNSAIQSEPPKPPPVTPVPQVDSPTAPGLVRPAVLPLPPTPPIVNAPAPPTPNIFVNGVPPQKQLPPQPPMQPLPAQPPVQPPMQPLPAQPPVQPPTQPPQRPPMQPPAMQPPTPAPEPEASNFNTWAKPGLGARNFRAGEVVAPGGSKTQVAILQANEADVEKSTEDGTSQQANTKSGHASSGTSPVIVTLVVLAVVGGVALAGVAFVVKKKRMADKLDDRNEAAMRAFDTFSSPVHFEKTIAKI